MPYTPTQIGADLPRVGTAAGAILLPASVAILRSILSASFRALTRGRVVGLCVPKGVPWHPTDESQGQFFDAAAVDSRIGPPCFEVVELVRPVAAVRIVGARIAVRCAVVDPVRAGVLEKLKLVFRRVFHGNHHGGWDVAGVREIVGELRNV